VKRAVLAWGPAAVWAAVLFLSSEWSGLPRSVWAALNDKLIHLALYGVLGATLAWGKNSASTAPPHWALLLLGVAYGALDEWHQSFVPRRDPSLDDLLADVVGVGVGYLLLWLVSSRWGRIRSGGSSAPDPASSD